MLLNSLIGSCARDTCSLVNTNSKVFGIYDIAVERMSMTSMEVIVSIRLIIIFKYYKTNSMVKSCVLLDTLFFSFLTQACKQSCLAQNQLEICGCMEYKFPTDKVPVCDITNRTVSK